jgi:membrane protein DedA with SNARE-associated domain
MPFKRFFLMAFCGELIWSVMWFYVSFIPLNFRHALFAHWPITVAALACIIIGLALYQKRLKRKGSSLGKVLWHILIGN